MVYRPNGIRAAIVNMKPPTELRCILGRLGKLSPRLAEITQPMRKLLSKTSLWHWDQPQEAAFVRLKSDITKPMVLVHYDPKVNTKVSADASSFGLWAVFLQRNDVWKSVAFASHTMSATEYT